MPQDAEIEKGKDDKEASSRGNKIALIIKIVLGLLIVPTIIYLMRVESDSSHASFFRTLFIFLVFCAIAFALISLQFIFVKGHRPSRTDQTSVEERGAVEKETSPIVNILANVIKIGLGLLIAPSVIILMVMIAASSRDSGTALFYILVLPATAFAVINLPFVFVKGLRHNKVNRASVIILVAVSLFVVYGVAEHFIRKMDYKPIDKIPAGFLVLPDEAVPSGFKEVKSSQSKKRYERWYENPYFTPSEKRVRIREWEEKGSSLRILEFSGSCDSGFKPEMTEKRAISHDGKSADIVINKRKEFVAYSLRWKDGEKCLTIDAISRSETGLDDYDIEKILKSMVRSQ